MRLNPEASPSPPISPRLMFSYDRGLNKSWNMPEYKTPRIYQDPKLEVQKRQWATQKKGQKSDKYETKRGFYMDYHIKVKKSLPAPCAHNSQEPWSFKKEQEKGKNIKIDSSLKKNTYIEQIENEQAKRKKPGVCTYSLEKSMKQKQQAIQKLKQRVIKASQKRYFYEDTEHLSERVPGSGNYNPHDEVSKLKATRSDYKFWVDKHKKEFDRDKKRSLIKPTAGTYRPLYQSFNTFDKTSRQSSGSLKKKNAFGSDSRFPYLRPDKKKIKEVRPSPASYNTGMTWRGKTDKNKNKNWHEAIWKGSMTESIYLSKN